MKIVNPILQGFNPDHFILRVGDDYYIATSIFEWFPVVQIHHSRDLYNWRLLTRPLNRTFQLYFYIFLHYFIDFVYICRYNILYLQVGGIHFMSSIIRQRIGRKYLCLLVTYVSSGDPFLYYDDWIRSISCFSVGSMSSQRIS